MKIVIADNHPLFRDGLKSLLASHDHEVVGEAPNGKEAVRLAHELRPDVVLMDLKMPEMDGIEATRRITTELPEVKVVVLTAYDEDSNLFEAIKGGASGYLLKDLESKRFFELLEGVERDEPALTPSLAKKLLEEFARPGNGNDDRREDPDALTEREGEVLARMVDGVTSNRDLARELGVSENTIKFHVRNILDKLHLHNRAQAVAYALKSGLVPVDGDDGDDGRR